MQKRKPNPHIIKLKRGSFFDGVFFHTATKDELMAHYWGRFDVLSDGDGYGLFAEGVLTPYATHFSAGGERPVAFVVKGISKLMDADGRTHWPFAEIGNYIVDDEDPHLYRRLARSVVKAISDMGCGIFGDFSARYGVVAGDIQRNSENTNIVFSATTVPGGHQLRHALCQQAAQLVCWHQELGYDQSRRRFLRRVHSLP